MPKEIYKRTPEHNAAVSKVTKGIPKPLRTPEHCAAISKACKGVPKPTRTPEHCAALSKATKGISRSPETCAAISKAKKDIPNPHTTPAQIAADEAKRGGNDLVDHHYIYDHSDLSLNTVKMARKDHMRLHRLLQKLGYVVPHININVEKVS